MGIVDTHFHVIAQPARFPMRPGRAYTPVPAGLDDWRATLGPGGVSHGVVVQPSIYGTDNRALLAALADGAGQLVGVAAVDAGVSDAELDRLAAAGVRGVRMALFEPGDERGRAGLVPFADFDVLAPRLAERGMHLDLFTDSRLLPGVAARLQRSCVPVVIDHMGRTPAALGAMHEGLLTLCALMRDTPLWVKLSGIANVSDQPPDYADARRVHEALLQAAPRRVVWGSDWPHTRPGGARPDTRALLALAQAWTPPALHADVFGRNAQALYRFAASIDAVGPCG